MNVDRRAIASAHSTIRPYLRATPILEVSGAEFGLSDCTLVLKLELLQHSGSFKARGAFANLLLRDVPPAGVVAASGGNHGAAVAYAAMRLGIPARIFVPSVASPAKIARIRAYGAELVVGGDLYDDAFAASEEWRAQSGALSIHPFNAPETLLGAGSAALELEAQAPRLDTLLVAVGGGGFIGATAAWYEGAVDLIGVEPESAPTLTHALAAGRPVEAPAGGIAADSLAPRRVGELIFPLAQRYLRAVKLVPDDAIRNAQRVLWEKLRVAAEPGGAAAFSALLSGQYVPRAGERVGVMVCGANTDAVDFDRS